MSSPLATFRKHRTYWMAGLVLLAIMAFVVAPAIDFMQGAMINDTGGNRVVVRWNGGRITAGELERGRQQHYKFVRFLSTLSREVIEAGGQPQIPEFAFSPESKQIIDLGVNVQSSDLAIIETRMLADFAKSNGIEFDDDAADEFLVAFCDKRVSPSRLAEILRESTDKQVTEFDLRELIKLELGAIVARQMALRGWSNDFKPDDYERVRLTQTPGDMWSDFLKLNQSVKLEAYPVLVSDFVKSVTGEPTEAEILAIYEKGKSRIPSPVFPEPGFLRDYKANFEFVEGNFGEWIEREKAKVTEDQIKAEYDKAIALGQLKYNPLLDKSKKPAEPNNTEPANTEPTNTEPTNTEPTKAEPTKAEPTKAEPGTTDTPAQAPSNPAPETTPPESSLPPDADEAAPAPGDPATPATSEAPANAPETPATETPATETPATETPAPETPAPEAPAPEAPAAEAPAARAVDSPKQLSSTRMTGKVRLVSTQDEPEPTEQKSEKPDTEQAPAEEKPAEEKPAEEKPAEQTPAEEKPAEQAVPPATDPNAVQDSNGLPPVVVQPAAPGTEAAATPAATGTAKPELRNKTLEEAREELIESLARTAVIDSLQKELTSANELMLKYASAYREQSALLKEGVQPDKKATRPDLRKFVDVGLKHGETGMVDRSKLYATELGKSTMSLQEQGMGQVPMPNYSMNNPSYGLFTPAQSLFFDQMAMLEQRTPDFRQYIFWKIDEQQGYTPELAEVRDEVIAAWKTQRARVLAADEAAKVAKKVTGTEEPWKDALTLAQQSLVVTTDPFTWLSGFGETPRISNVPTLDSVGQQFMEKVFTTAPTAAGVAANQGQNIYYAYRVVEMTPTIKELEDRFAADPNKMAARRVGLMTGQQIYTGLYETIEDRLNVKWEVRPSELDEQ